MLVPRTAPGQLGFFFSTPIDPTNVDAQYEMPMNNTIPIPKPYGHLPDFLSSDEMKVNNPFGQSYNNTFWQVTQTTGSGAKGANWNLILELIETAPPFEDSVQRVDPNKVPSSSQDVKNLVGGYLAPFNFFPKYRSPGKVNINTINQRAVWEALEWNYDLQVRQNTGSASKWFDVKKLRRGYDVFPSGTPGFLPTGQLNKNLDPTIPSQFRGAMTNAFTNNLDVANQPYPTAPPAPPAPISPEAMRQQRSVMSTILRPANVNTAVSISNNRMLLGPEVESQRQAGNATLDLQIKAEQSRQPYFELPTSHASP